MSVFHLHAVFSLSHHKVVSTPRTRCELHGFRTHQKGDWGTCTMNAFGNCVSPWCQSMMSNKTPNSSCQVYLKHFSIDCFIQNSDSRSEPKCKRDPLIYPVLPRKRLWKVHAALLLLVFGSKHLLSNSNLNASVENTFCSF